MVALIEIKTDGGPRFEGKGENSLKLLESEVLLASLSITQ